MTQDDAPVAATSEGAPTSMVEKERKYDVDDAVELPHLHGFVAHRPNSFTLRAEYFDTDRRELLRRRIVLRRRSGGPDEGWHLKVEELEAADARREFHAPLADEPPALLLDRVRAIIRDHPLQLIATITTLRTAIELSDYAGATVAEVADDRVEASDARTGILQLWREWEVELVGQAGDDAEADSALLDRLEQPLIEAGAVPSRFPSKLVRAVGDRTPPPAPRPRTALEVTLQVLSYLRDSLLDADADIRAGEAEGIHDMRITIGRLRAILAALRKVLDAEVTNDIRERLSGVVRVLEPARDAQVRRERATQLLDEDDHANFPGDVRTRLVTDVARQEQAARTDVVAYLETSEYFRLLDDLDALITRPPLASRYAAKPRAQIGKALRKQVRRAVKRLGSVDERDLTSMHDARKAVRRARYAIEAFTQPPVELFGAKWSAFATEAKAVQDAAGDHRDALLFVAHLQSTARDAAADERNAWFYGMLAEAAAQRADELLKGFRRESSQFRDHAAAL